MKLTAVQKKKLTTVIRHITGTCNCPATSKSCLYWKHCDKGDDDWQVKLMLKNIEKLL